MFRSLRESFEKKKRSIEQQVLIQKKAYRIVAQYGEPAKVVYDAQEHLLKIEVRSKTLASELLLQAGEIGASLRAEGIAVKQLIIR